MSHLCTCVFRYGSGTEEGKPRDHPPPERPEFPPPHLNFQRWLPSEMEGNLGGDLLFVWNFLRSFRSLLCIPPITVHKLLRALQRGEKSRLLGELHISMIRIVQADMEEAHATGAMQVGLHSLPEAILLFPALRGISLLCCSYQAEDMG